MTGTVRALYDFRHLLLACFQFFLFFCFTILQHSDLRNHVICHILGGIDTINIALLLGHLGSRLLVSFPQLLRAA